MSAGDSQPSWTEPELVQFFEAVRESLTSLNEHRQSGKAVPDEFWQTVSSKVGSKSAEQLRALYSRQSNLLHVPGVTKEIFLASVADLMKVVEVVAPKVETPAAPGQNSPVAAAALRTLFTEGASGDDGANTGDARRRKRKFSEIEDEYELAPGSDAEARSNPAQQHGESSPKTNKANGTNAAGGAPKRARRTPDEFSPEEPAEEGVAELLALIMSPGKPPTPTPPGNGPAPSTRGSQSRNRSRPQQQQSRSRRRSDEMSSADGDDMMDMDITGEESLEEEEEMEESEEDDSFADDPIARKLLEKNLVLALRNSRFQLWCMYEWLYPNIDLPWYTQNEFQACLNALNLGHVVAGTRAQWSHIRSVLGRPRRFSPQFLIEQRDELAEARVNLRAEVMQPNSTGVGGLAPSVLSLNINERCIAFHAPTKQVFKGVLKVKLGEGVYKVAFDPFPPSHAASIAAAPPTEPPPTDTTAAAASVSSSTARRQWKDNVWTHMSPPPASDLVSDDWIMSLRYNIATIDRLQKPSVPRKPVIPNLGPGPQYNMLTPQLPHTMPLPAPAPAMPQRTSARHAERGYDHRHGSGGGYSGGSSSSAAGQRYGASSSAQARNAAARNSGASASSQRRSADGRYIRRPQSEEEDSLDNVDTPVRYYHPQQRLAGGAPSNVSVSEGRARHLAPRSRGQARGSYRGAGGMRGEMYDEHPMSPPQSSSEDEESREPGGPPSVLLHPPATSVYQPEDVVLSARVFTLLQTKEIMLQDLHAINEEADRCLGPGALQTSPEDAIPDELRRAYVWLVRKMAKVDERLKADLAKLTARQQVAETQQPFLSSQALTELSVQQRPTLAGGMFANWYLEMGRACRRQVQAIVDPVLENRPPPALFQSPTEEEAVSEAKQIAFNAANMVIHITSCRNLPLSTEQVALSLDAALSQLKPKFAQNQAVYAQIRDVVAAYQAKIATAAVASSPNAK